MKNAVEYKGVWLMKNSEAYQMWLLKDWKKLDKHMKELDAKEKELLQRYK